MSERLIVGKIEALDDKPSTILQDGWSVTTSHGASVDTGAIWRAAGEADLRRRIVAALRELSYAHDRLAPYEGEQRREAAIRIALLDSLAGRIERGTFPPPPIHERAEK